MQARWRLLGGLIIAALSLVGFTCSAQESGPSIHVVLSQRDFVPLSKEDKADSPSWHSAMALGVSRLPPYQPIGEGSCFPTTAERIYSWFEFTDISGPCEVTWKWYSPEGSLWTTTEVHIPPGQWNSYAVWAFLYCRGTGMAFIAGAWHVDVFLDGRFLASQRFTVASEWTQEEEPNNEPSQAQEVSTEQQICGELGIWEDEDWYHFEIAGTVSYYIILTSSRSYSEDMFFVFRVFSVPIPLDPLAYDDEGGRRWGECIALPGPGSYYIRVSHSTDLLLFDSKYMIDLVTEKPWWCR